MITLLTLSFHGTSSIKFVFVTSIIWSGILIIPIVFCHRSFLAAAKQKLVSNLAGGEFHQNWPGWRLHAFGQGNKNLHSWLCQKTRQRFWQVFLACFVLGGHASIFPTTLSFFWCSCLFFLQTVAGRHMSTTIFLIQPLKWWAWFVHAEPWWACCKF